MTDPFDMMAEDAARIASLSPTDTSNATYASMLDAAKGLVALQDRIAKGTALLKTLQEQERALAEQTIPTLMAELQIRHVTLDSGASVALETNTHAKLSEPKKADAYEWLRANGHDDVIKAVVSLQFGKGETLKRQQTEKLLDDHHLSYAVKEDVHHSTYKALMRELLAEGVAVPLDTMGVYIQTVAVVTTN